METACDNFIFTLGVTTKIIIVCEAWAIFLATVLCGDMGTCAITVIRKSFADLLI